MLITLMYYEGQPYVGDNKKLEHTLIHKKQCVTSRNYKLTRNKFNIAQRCKAHDKMVE